MEKFVVYMVDDHPSTALIALMESAGAKVISVTKKERAAQSGPDAGYRTADLVLVGSNNPEEIDRGVHAMTPSGPFDLLPRVLTYINTETAPDFPKFWEEDLAEYRTAVLMHGVDSFRLQDLLDPVHSPLLPIIRREEPVHVFFAGEFSPELHAQQQKIALQHGTTVETLGSGASASNRLMRMIGRRQLVVVAFCPDTFSDSIRIAHLAAVRPGGVPKRQVIMHGPANMRSFCGRSGMFCAPEQSAEVLRLALEELKGKAAA